jgi:hypothetical protein
MEKLLCFDVVNSAPVSECEDTDEVLVFSRTPASLGNLEFKVDEILFSPTGVSVLSSLNFVETFLASQSIPKPIEKKDKTHESYKTSVKNPKNLKCNSCEMVSEDLRTLSCKCCCNV